jgi:hypothetical protein
MSDFRVRVMLLNSTFNNILVVCTSIRCHVLANFDHFIFGFFAMEMIIKMIAMGIYGKSTYLDDSWNKLDCFIVIAG